MFVREMQFQRAKEFSSRSKEDYMEELPLHANPHKEYVHSRPTSSIDGEAKEHHETRAYRTRVSDPHGLSGKGFLAANTPELYSDTMNP